MNKFIIIAMMVVPFMTAKPQVRTDTTYRKNYENINDLKITNTDTGFVVSKKPVVKAPTFVGGSRALQLFIAANVKYPRNAAEKNISGTVIVKFTVDSVGAVKNVKIAKQVFYDFDQEALRVVNMLPDWNPATRDGIPIEMDMMIPIVFGKRN